MRAPKFEIGYAVCMGTEEELRNLLESERVARYTDVIDGDSWGKVFRKGGPLEWCNDTSDIEGHGIQEIAVPHVSDLTDPR